MARVGLITTHAEALEGEEHVDTEPLAEALDGSGILAEAVIWHEPRDWSCYDAVVFRSPWDYPERMTEFMDWMAATETQVRMINSPQLIRWNLDKRYLGALAARGVECVPTAFCATLEEVSAALERHASGNVVVKPNISIGSRHTGLFRATQPEALELCREILQQGKVVMIQPEIEAVQQDAERGLLFFNGRHSHTIVKGAILKPGGGYHGGHYIENIRPAEPSPTEIALGERVMAAIHAIATAEGWGEDAAVPLYARIDMVTPPGAAPLLLEAELFEPAMFVKFSDGALERFVEAIRVKLGD